MKRFMKTTAVILVLLTLLSGCGNKYEKAYEKGLKYLTNGDYEQATLAFTEAISIDPKQYTAYYERGKVYLATGAYNDAISDFKFALDNGMKAPNMPREVSTAVAESIISDYGQKNAEDLLVYFDQTGYLDEGGKDAIENSLSDIVVKLVVEYNDGGKKMEDLITTLNNIGLIDGDKVSDLFNDTLAGITLQDILDYSNAGKTLEELIYDKFTLIDKGINFSIIDVSDVIAKIPDFSRKAQDFYGWRVYDFKCPANTEMDVRKGNTNVMFMMYKKAAIFITDKKTGHKDVVIYYNTKPIMTIETDKGIVTYFYDRYDITPDGYLSLYLEAVSKWNSVLSKYGFTLNDLFENTLVINNMEQW